MPLPGACSFFTMPAYRVFTVYFETRFLDYCLPKCAAWLLDMRLVWRAAKFTSGVKRAKAFNWCQARESSFTIYKKTPENMVWKKMKHDFLVVPGENFRQQRNIWKGSPVLLDELFQTKILVPFLQSHSEIFSVLSSAHTWTSVILAGNRDSRRHPTTVRLVSGPRGLFP